ncbi:MAG: fatty acid CoA ligase family protein [Pirellulaceae bacterium]
MTDAASELQLTNVGQLLSHAAVAWPDHPAVAEPDGTGWRHVSFAELEADSNRIAKGLHESGVQSGQRLGMLVPPGIDFVSLVFALFKTGAVIILIDPGIGRKNLVRCLSDARPEGIVGIAKAQIARWIFRKRFPQAKNNFVVGRRLWPGCTSIEGFRQRPADEFKIDPGDADSPAAIIFTSGSTGPPKGVGYSHGNFITQAHEIQRYFDIQHGGADISGFPLFALFNTAMGVTTVFPRMDFTRPAEVSPEVFVSAAEHWQANQSFGSPALWNTVSRWCEKQKRNLPTIERVMSAGAPVPAHVLKRVKQIIAPHGDVFTPYGATEALPVACNSASIVLSETGKKTDEGKGVCVGGRFPQIDWRVIEITDGPIQTMADAVELEPGQIGELVVSGPVVTREYVTRTDANAGAKIQDGDRFWHRMGDVGYMDEHRRFWFCGRKSQRVICGDKTLFTVPCESIINTHPAIYRSALVGIGPRGQQQPVIVAEPWPDHWPATVERRERLCKELTGLAAGHDVTSAIKDVRLQKRLPVDIRHNSKIFREQIANALAREFA